MAVAMLVPVEEYLSTSYAPDRDYVDGCLIERNVGEHNHSFLTFIVAMALHGQKLRTCPNLRFQIRSGKFRVPDILALAPGKKPGARYETETPYIVVEILSPEDRVSDLSESLSDYFDRSVPNIWVVDPDHKSITAHQRTEARTHFDRIATADARFSLDIADIFRQLAEDAA